MAPGTVTGRGQALPSLTGVRGVAAFAVFASHLPWAFPPDRQGGGFTDIDGSLPLVLDWGATGVSLFFVLSGFVLAWTWSNGTDDRTFWRRRFARVWPLHAVLWAAFVMASLWGIGPSTRPAPALANLLLVHCWLPGLGWANVVNPLAWTLSCEAFFYLVFPWVIRPIRGLDPRRMIIAAVTVAGVGGTIIVALLEPRGITATTFPPFRVWEFLLGVIAATAIRSGHLRSAPPVLASTVLLAGALWAETWAKPARGPAIVVVTLAFLSIICRLAVTDLYRPSRGVLSCAVAQRAGEWSYAFYLVQVLPWLFLDHFGFTPTTWSGSLGVIGVWFATTVLAAAGLHHLVERPGVALLRSPPIHEPAVTGSG